MIGWGPPDWRELVVDALVPRWLRRAWRPVDAVAELVDELTGRLALAWAALVAWRRRPSR